jgi:hypothetical protein
MNNTINENYLRGVEPLKHRQSASRTNAEPAVNVNSDLTFNDPANTLDKPLMIDTVISSQEIKMNSANNENFLRGVEPLKHRQSASCMNAEAAIIANHDANEVNDRTHLKDYSDVPCLMDTKVRLSAANCQYLYDLGYRFPDIRATIEIDSIKLPAIICVPNSWRPFVVLEKLNHEIQSLAPHEIAKNILDKLVFKYYTTQKVGNTKVLSANDTVMTWTKWDTSIRRECPCAKQTSAKYCNEDLEDWCDHPWHSWTFIIRNLDASKFNVNYTYYKGSWIATCTYGKLYAEYDCTNKTLAIASVVEMIYAKYLSRKLKCVDAIPNMEAETTSHDNADNGLSSQNAAGPSQITVDTSGNVALANARADSQGVAALIKPSRVIDDYFTESNAVFPHLTDRFLNLPTLTWTNNDAFGSIIYTASLPYDLIAANQSSPNIAPFFAYAFSRPQMTVRAMMQSVPANGGHLVIAVRYSSLEEIFAPGDNWAITHVAQLLQMDHIKLSAQSSNTSDLSVPFQHFLDRISNTWTSQSNMLYYATLYVGVLNPLVVGTGSLNSVNVNFYISLKCGSEHTRFYGQRNIFNPFIPAPTTRSQLTYSEQRAIIDAIPNGFMDILGSGLQAVAPLGNLIAPGLGSVLESGSSLATGIGGLFKDLVGIPSRPLVNNEAPMMILTPTPNLSIASLPVDARTMRLDKGVETPHHPGRLSNENHLNNRYITSIKGLVGSFQVTSAQTPDTIVYEHDITPIDGYPISTGTYIYTPTGNLGLVYNYYSGDLNFEFIVGSGLMHSLRLRIVYIPDYSNTLLTGVSNFEQRSDLYSVVYDIQEQQILEFRVPFQSLTPMNRIWAKPYATDLTAPQRFGYGRLRVYLETPLISNNSSSSNINVAVLQSGASNFDYAVPRSSPFIPLRRNATIEAQPNMEEERIANETLVSPQPFANNGIAGNIGERHDISNVIHRHAIIAEQIVTFTAPETGASRVIMSWPVNASLPTVRQIGISQAAVEPDNQDSGTLDPLTLIQDAFRFNKGSFRYNISVDSPLPLTFDVFHLTNIDRNRANQIGNPLAITVANEGNYFGSGMGSGTAAETFNTAYNPYCTIEVPFYNQTTCLLSDTTREGLEEVESAFANGRIQLVSKPILAGTPPFNFTVTLWRAAGNDLRFAAYQGFPPYPTTSGIVPYQGAGRVPAPTPPPQDFRYSLSKLNHHARRAVKLAERKATPNMFSNIANIPRNVNRFLNTSTRAQRSLADLADTFANLVSRLSEQYDQLRNINMGSLMAHFSILIETSSTTYSKISAFFGILCQLGIVSVSMLTTLVGKLWDLMTRFSWTTDNDMTGNPLGAMPADPYDHLVRTANTDPRHTYDANPNAFADDLDTVSAALPDIAEIASLFASSFCIANSISQHATSLSTKLKDFTNIAARSKSITNFFELILKWSMVAIRWVTGIVDPKVQHARNLSEQSEAMKAWSIEVDLLCATNNQDRIFSSQDFQRRVCDAKELATTFFNDIPNLPTSIRPSLIYYHKIINELYNQVGLRAGGGHKPQEAVSIWWYGEPGCGKSNALDQYCIDAMKAMKIVYDGNPIYVRDGNPFWNGLHGQPCIKWDDVGVNRGMEWMQTFVSEYFNVHTCAPFNPSQADLKDKHRIINARLIAIGSNATTFNEDVIGNKEAFNRRRDLVFCVRLNRDYIAEHAPDAKNCNDPRLTADLLAYPFPHLQFRLQPSTDLINRTKETDGWMSYLEMLDKTLPIIKSIDAKRKAAANAKKAHETALSAATWAAEHDTVVTNPPGLRSLRSDLDALYSDTDIIQTTPGPLIEPTPATPNMIPEIASATWEFIRNRFTDRRTAEYYTEFAFPTTHLPALHDVEFHDDWESILDWTRIGCQHRNVGHNWNMNLDTDNYEFRTLHVPFGSCGDECALTERGLLVLKLELIRVVETRMGIRVEELTGPEEIRNLTQSRPAYNIHTIIDSAISFANSPIISDFLTPIIAVITLVVVRNRIVKAMDDATTAYFDGERKLKKDAACIDMLTEQSMRHYLLNNYKSDLPEDVKRRAQINEIFNELEAKILENNPDVDLSNPAWPNIAHSGDPKTLNQRRAQRRVASRQAQLNAAPNNQQEPSPKIKKNIFKIESINSKTGNALSIHGLGIQGRNTLVPKHFFKRCSNDKPVFTDIEIGSQTYHNLVQKKSNTFFSAQPLSGPLRLTHKTKPAIYVWYSRFYTKDQEDSSLMEAITHWPEQYLISCTGLSEDSERLYTVHRSGLSTTVKHSQLQILDLLTDEDLDMQAVIFPSRIPEFHNLQNLIATDDDHDKTSLENLDLLLADKPLICSLSNVECTSVKLNYQGLGTTEVIGYSYRNPTGYFPCSSILWNPVHSKILGLHVASSGSLGFSIAISPDILPFKLTHDKLDLPLDLSAEPVINLTGEFITIGAIENGISYPTKTTIIPSLLNKDLPTTRYPVKLTEPGEKPACVTSLTKGCNKQCVFAPIPETSTTAKYIDDFLHTKIIVNSKPVCAPLAKRDVTTALNGIVGVPFMDPIKFNTAAGYPWNLKGKPSKSDLIQRSPTGQITYMDPELIKLYNEEHQQRLDGLRPPVVFSDFLKDERLKPGKDARLINGSPLTYTIEVRRYFLDFVAAFQTHRLKNHIAVGMNVHGMDTTHFMQYLRSKGQNFICGDYTSFGPTLDPDAVVAFSRLVNGWYDHYCPDNTPLDNSIRTGLLLDTACSVHLVYNLLFQVACGSPSGHPLTVDINSYVNLRYLCRAWLALTKQMPEYNTLKSFTDHVGIVVYGDDVIMTTTDEITDFFNNLTISDYFSLIGIKYTDATKTGTELFCDYTKATFLKNYFSKHPTRPGRWLAGLDKTMINEIPAWIRKTPDIKAATEENIRAALLKAHGHGPTYFDDFKETMITLAKNRNLEIDPLDWNTIDDNFYDENCHGVTYSA